MGLAALRSFRDSQLCVHGRRGPEDQMGERRSLVEALVLKKKPAMQAPVADQHPMGKERFEALVDIMTRGKKLPAEGTSTSARRGGYADTRTRRGSSKDTSR